MQNRVTTSFGDICHSCNNLKQKKTTILPIMGKVPFDLISVSVLHSDKALLLYFPPLGDDQCNERQRGQSNSVASC